MEEMYNNNYYNQTIGEQLGWNYQNVNHEVPKMTQPLTREQIDHLNQIGSTYTNRLNSVPKEIGRIIGTNKDHNDMVLQGTEDGLSFCPINKDTFMSTQMYLSKEQVKELIPILQKFLDWR